MKILNLIRWDGNNSQEICRAVTGLKLEPFELGGGVWLRQPSIDYLQLAVPSTNGEVFMEKGDYVVQNEDHSWTVKRSELAFQSESFLAAYIDWVAEKLATVSPAIISEESGYKKAIVRMALLEHVKMKGSL